MSTWAHGVGCKTSTPSRWASTPAPGSARLEPLVGVVRDPTDTTDVGAHIAGFLVGIVLGALLSAWHARPRGIPTAARRAMAVALAAILAGSWLAAATWGA